MSLEVTTVASIIKDKYNELKDASPVSPSRELLDIIGSALDDGFQKATPSLCNFDISAPAGTLTIPLADSNTMSDAIGQACAEYWLKTAVPKTPASCGAISSVSNDAGKIAANITNNLRKLSGKKTSAPVPFFDFVDAIYKEVKTIKWIINESDSSGCSATLNGTVS